MKISALGSPTFWGFKISPRKVSSALSVTAGIKIAHLLSNNTQLNLVVFDCPQLLSYVHGVCALRHSKY